MTWEIENLYKVNARNDKNCYFNFKKQIMSTYVLSTTCIQQMGYILKSYGTNALGNTGPIEPRNQEYTFVACTLALVKVALCKQTCVPMLSKTRV